MLYMKDLNSMIINLFQQVTELSRPSSLEVEDIIHQLVRNILRIFFKDDITSAEISVTGNRDDRPDGDNEFCDTISTSRDYLAKLLFWLEFCSSHS